MTSADASLTTCATDWNNFNNPGYIADYTYLGQVIGDEQTSADSSHGPATVPPTWTDLASGSPGSYPGPEATAMFGYYDGGTPWDENDPITLEDDYIYFRFRLDGDPSKGVAFDSKHWNVLFDVDGDGYKEYWVDLEGSYSANGADRVQVLYDNQNRQDVPDPNAARVAEFTALHTADGGCAGTSPGISHTRVVATNDGTGDYWIEMQVPMTAFNDTLGNQVLFPDSPIAFVFSTGASTQDPLQKDWMQDLSFLSNADPITFGDVIIPNGQPKLSFTDVNLTSVDFYSVGSNVYLYLTDPASNDDSTVVECIDVTVTNPASGDDERVTVCETGPATGIFTNKGGACRATITNPSPAPNPATAWINAVRTSNTTVDETWTVTYSSGTNNWIVTGSVSGTQTARATAGAPYTSDNGAISFTLYQNGPANGTVLSFCTKAADPLTTSSTSGADDDGDLEVSPGDTIAVSYTNPNALTVTDTAEIVGPCDAFIRFTRANGLLATSFQLTTDPATSDRIYVTVIYAGANTNPATAQTIQVTLTGYDTQTLTLTETGVNTGVFRNTTGLQTKVEDGVVTPNDNLWEDVDKGVVTATYNYTCGGSNLSASTTAPLFYTASGGWVYFTNGAGTQDVDLYGAGQPVFLKVTDGNACTTGGTIQVVVTSPSGDSETVTLYETFTGSGVFMNRENDLVTTAGSAVVTSASSTFLTDGVQAGDTFVIATGPDTGTYTVASVNSQTQLTLTQTLSTTRTSIGFTAAPLLAATSDGSVAADDGVLESNHDDTVTVSYVDCNDGDPDSSNNTKTDTAKYNAPGLVLNEVLFYPDFDPTVAGSCQTEAIEILNTRTSAINATGYTVSDDDAFSYTVPQLNGSDITLQPGQKIFISLWGANPPSDFYYNGTYYLFTSVGSTYPADQLADPASADKSDQVALYDASNVVQDYVGWSATLTPSIDFYGDDSPAVLRSIWQDDAFRDVRTLSQGQAIVRSPDGVDTNKPSDWAFSQSTTCQVIATRASVSDFRAFREKGRVVVEWQTSSEDGTVGFYVLRQDERTGRWVRVGRGDVVPALLDAPQGGTYRVEDNGVRPGADRATYALMEIESRREGTREIGHGPYSVGIGEETFTGSPLAARGRRAAPRAPSRRDEARLRAHRESHERWQETSRRAVRSRGEKIKLAVSSNGLYSVSADRIAALLGASPQRVSDLIRRTELKLTNQGRDIAWMPHPDSLGLSFWGEAIESIYTRENVYWLEVAPGTTMRTAGGAGPRQAASGASFTDTLHFEEDLFPATLVARDPESDYWFWRFIMGGDASFGRQTFTLSASGVASSGSGRGAPPPRRVGSGLSGVARLTVSLYGATAGESGKHHVAVKLNGVPLGEGRWQDIAPYRLSVSFDQSLLREGDNTVELVGVLDPGVPLSIFYVDALDLSYERHYRTKGPSFVCRSAGNRVVTVSGFAEPELQVLDVTNPARPIAVRALTVDSAPDGYRVSFRTAPDSPEPMRRGGSPELSATGVGPRRLKEDDAPRHEPDDLTPRVYAVLNPSAVLQPVEIWKDEPSRLRSASNAAEYVIIAPEELVESARNLATLRTARGMTTMVVVLEDVLDEFNFGISSPHAVRRFLARAYRGWAVPPRYVVLAGAGNLDYRNYWGRGGNLLPPLMTSTPEGLYASDSRLADVDRDGWPEMSIGRLPVLTAAELDAYVEKVRAYEGEGGAPWREHVLLVADDNPNGVGDFAKDSESMATVLPQSVRAERIYLAGLGAEGARSQLFAGLREGALLLNYVGHGGLDRFADEVLLQTSDVPRLETRDRLPIVSGFSCTINRFELPGFSPLGAALTIEPGGGAAAVWAPSGVSLDNEARTLGGAFFRALFQDRHAVLGDAIVASLRDYRARGGLASLAQIYNLLGDPALTIP